MYRVIGADQKQYGPITGDQLRVWIRDGRVNAQTHACAEGTNDWKPLGSFPEFADVFPEAAAPNAPPITTSAFPSESGRAAALQAVKGPAIGLLVTAIVGLLCVALGTVLNVLSLSGHPIRFGPQAGDPQIQQFINRFGGGFGLLQDVLGGIIGIVVIIAALKMQKLQSFQFVFMASILAMIPCLSPCCVLGLPFGIWALVVLNKPEVKSQFG